MGTGFTNNWWFDIGNRRFIWQKRFVWWPQKSYESNKFIWLKHAWYGRKWLEGPAGEHAVKIERWLTEKEYVFHLLKSN